MQLRCEVSVFSPTVTPCLNRNQKMSNPTKPTQAIIVKTLKKGGLELLGKYVNNKTPLKCRCLKCGEIVYPKYNTITQGTGGCKPCGYKKLANRSRLPKAEIMRR